MFSAVFDQMRCYVAQFSQTVTLCRNKANWSHSLSLPVAFLCYRYLMFYKHMSDQLNSSPESSVENDTTCVASSQAITQFSASPNHKASGSVKSIYSMWQDLSPGQKQTMITLAMTESNTPHLENQPLSEDLEGVTVIPLPAEFKGQFTKLCWIAMPWCKYWYYNYMYLVDLYKWNFHDFSRMLLLF